MKSETIKLKTKKAGNISCLLRTIKPGDVGSNTSRICYHISWHSFGVVSFVSKNDAIKIFIQSIDDNYDYLKNTIKALQSPKRR
jgi:hypothetical protein